MAYTVSSGALNSTPTNVCVGTAANRIKRVIWHASDFSTFTTPCRKLSAQTVKLFPYFSHSEVVRGLGIYFYLFICLFKRQRQRAQAGKIKYNEHIHVIKQDTTVVR